MTRRILLVLLAFTAVIIAGAMVPLALPAIAHDRNSFDQATAATARTDAAVAQARLDDIFQAAQGASPTQADAPLLTLLTEVEQAGDGLLILESDGHVLADKHMPIGDWGDLAQRADQASELANKLDQPIMPVIVTQARSSGRHRRVPGRRGAGPAGRHGAAVQVDGSAEPRHRAAVGHPGHDRGGRHAGRGAAGVRAGPLGGRPLAALDSAARRLADGNLASRAVVDSGPPELRRLGTTFNTMAGRLEALVHGNRAVIADVSHQLRTPLAALRLRLDLLAADTDPDPETTGHELAGALDELGRLSRLVDGLLAVARAENVVPVPTAVEWPRWPRNGSWRGTRWPTTGASRSRPAKRAGPPAGRAHRCWPGSARATWSRSWTT